MKRQAAAFGQMMMTPSQVGAINHSRMRQSPL